MPVNGIVSFGVNGKDIAKNQQTNNRQSVNKTGQVSHLTNNDKKSKTPVVVAAVALAALGVTTVVYGKKKGWFAFKEQVKKESDKLKEITRQAIQKSGKDASKTRSYVEEVTNKAKDEALRVLKENTSDGGFINLGGIEQGAGTKSCVPGLETRYHDAATWIEEGYLEAYSRSTLTDGNNILDQIYNRMANESNSLATMYAQMPEEEAAVRHETFATRALEKDTTHTGLTVEQFVKQTINELIPKAKESLK